MATQYKRNHPCI